MGPLAISRTQKEKEEEEEEEEEEEAEEEEEEDDDDDDEGGEEDDEDEQRAWGVRHRLCYGAKEIAVCDRGLQASTPAQTITKAS